MLRLFIVLIKDGRVLKRLCWIFEYVNIFVILLIKSCINFIYKIRGKFIEVM